jgi:hypothetical protein
MPDWLQDNQEVMWWLGALSALTFIGTIVALPLLIVRIPSDYFTRYPRRRADIPTRHPVVHVTLIVLKNLLGVVLVAAGMLLTVLPGQGLITIFAGIMLLNFPGKFTLERWVVRQKAVMRTINWMRRRRGHPPLEAPPRRRRRPRPEPGVRPARAGEPPPPAPDASDTSC